jgi:AcrR family transcriptional regulator
MAGIFEQVNNRVCDIRNNNSLQLLKNYGNFEYKKSFRSIAPSMEEKEIKERILTGALELFMKYGIRSITMDDIARHLSISKKTIYQYYADKDEVVTMMSMMHLERNRVRCDSFKNAAKDAIDEMVRISICVRQDFQKINPSMLYDLQKYHATAWKKWIEHKYNYVKNSIVTNLKQGILEGFYRQEIEPEILAVARLELIQLTFNDQVFNPDKYDILEVHSQMFEQFIYGVLSERGRKVYEKYRKQTTLNSLIPLFQ